jgi:hypothetical protein
MMNSALNRALEGLGDYGMYADVIRLRNGRQQANELEWQNGHIEALEVFTRQQQLRYEHQQWEHMERQKEVRTHLIQANCHGSKGPWLEVSSLCYLFSTSTKLCYK